MISVIIPTLNEAPRIGALLGALRADAPDAEIVVADGGSADGTADVARGGASKVLSTPPGRGVQLKAGADAATGDILLFLHADSGFPAGGLAAIERQFAENPTLAGGNFRVVFDGDSGFSRWLTGFYAWFRTRGLYYGDSAVFVSRAAYDAIGGIRPLALMEDYDFNRRLERYGATCCIAEPALVTSSRRFEGRHPAAIFLGWLKIHALYYLGVSPERLARLYDSARVREKTAS